MSAAITSLGSGLNRKCWPIFRDKSNNSVGDGFPRDKKTSMCKLDTSKALSADYRVISTPKGGNIHEGRWFTHIFHRGPVKASHLLDAVRSELRFSRSGLSESVADTARGREAEICKLKSRIPVNRWTVKGLTLYNPRPRFCTRGPSKQRGMYYCAVPAFVYTSRNYSSARFPWGLEQPRNE